jgi:hypothetical protein
MEGTNISDSFLGAHIFRWLIPTYLFYSLHTGKSVTPSPGMVQGGSHDQTDAEWIVIKTQLRGHNNTPFGQQAPGQPSSRPGSGRSSGVFCMF